LGKGIGKLNVENAIIEKLTWKGILAYIAVSLAGSTEATTAALAGLVRAQTAVMLEGLKELTDVAPETVYLAKRGKWKCGGESIEAIVQNLDSNKYRVFVDDLSKYWKFLNPDIPFPMGGPDGTAIRQFLRDHQNWTPEQWRKCLHNRALSVARFGNGSRTESFVSWVRRLGDYAAGPMNAYNKPVEGSGKLGQTIATEAANRSAREIFIASRHGVSAER
jgi:hypothetical protein